MADIKQAAKWMNEGKRVRRPENHMKHDDFFMRDRRGFVVFGDRNLHDVLTTDDLLAEDWEIA